MLGFGSLSERQLESRVAEFAARLQAQAPCWPPPIEPEVTGMDRTVGARWSISVDCKAVGAIWYH